MTDLQKLHKAQELLSDIYSKYGELLKDNYSLLSNLSCADGCIIDAIEYLFKLKNSI